MSEVRTAYDKIGYERKALAGNREPEHQALIHKRTFIHRPKNMIRDLMKFHPPLFVGSRATLAPNRQTS